MSTCTVANACLQDIVLATASGYRVTLNGALHGRITLNVDADEFATWFGSGQWLPALASGLIYATPS